MSEDLPDHRGLEKLEAAMRKLPQVDCPLKHYFIPGLYVREIQIAAGTILVGYVHTQPCITTLSKGKIAISDGQETVVYEAPMTMICPAGSKKAGYALEDSVWSDAYVTEETNIDKLKDLLTAPSQEEYLKRLEAK